MLSISTVAINERQREKKARRSTNAISNTRLWTGRALSGLVVLFLLFDGIVKVLELSLVSEAMEQLGYPANVAFGLGVLTLFIAMLYAIPQTAVIGAILLTGLLGGAIATHLRVGSPVFTHLLFGSYIGLMAWAGLMLRDSRLSSLIAGNVLSATNKKNDPTR